MLASSVGAVSSGCASSLDGAALRRGTRAAVDFSVKDKQRDMVSVYHHLVALQSVSVLTNEVSHRLLRLGQLFPLVYYGARVLWLVPPDEFAINDDNNMWIAEKEARLEPYLRENRLYGYHVQWMSETEARHLKMRDDVAVYHNTAESPHMLHRRSSSPVGEGASGYLREEVARRVGQAGRRHEHR